MYVRSLSLQNLRSFEAEELHLRYPGEEPAPGTGTMQSPAPKALKKRTTGRRKTSRRRSQE